MATPALSVLSTPTADLRAVAIVSFSALSSVCFAHAAPDHGEALADAAQHLEVEGWQLDDLANVHGLDAALSWVMGMMFTDALRGTARFLHGLVVEAA